jgi:hypothetical protein
MMAIDPNNKPNYAALPAVGNPAQGMSVSKQDPYAAAAQDHSADWHDSPVGVGTYSASVRTQQGLMDSSAAAPSPQGQVATRLGMADSQVYNPRAPQVHMGQALKTAMSATGMRPATDTGGVGSSPFAQQILQTM